MVFAQVAGPLTWSIVALRNSLVLHSLDKVYLPSCQLQVTAQVSASGRLLASGVLLPSRTLSSLYCYHSPMPISPLAARPLPAPSFRLMLPIPRIPCYLFLSEVVVQIVASLLVCTCCSSSSAMTVKSSVIHMPVCILGCVTAIGTLQLAAHTCFPLLVCTLFNNTSKGYSTPHL